MRISEGKITYLAKEICNKMQKDKGITLNVPLEVLENKISGVILGNMKMEDEIEKEAKIILEQHQKEIRDGMIDYHSFFRKVKDRLVKQKGFVV